MSAKSLVPEIKQYTIPTAAMFRLTRTKPHFIQTRTRTYSSARPVNVAVVGATGAVGHELLQLLHSRSFPLSSLKLLASSRSAGQTIDFGGSSLVVESLSEHSFDGIDIALFSAGSERSREYAPAAVAAGAVVVDNSSAFRMEHSVFKHRGHSSFLFLSEH